MVDDAMKLNVEESMAYKPWSTDQFSGVLAKHTGEVRFLPFLVFLTSTAKIYYSYESLSIAVFN